MTPLAQHTTRIKRLCQEYNVKRLYAFGSVITNNFNDKSDIDLIVDFKPLELNQYGDNYFNLKFALEDVLQRPIDLLEEKTIKNPFFKTAVENKRLLIYGN